MQHHVPSDSRTYYGERFWNEIPEVRAHINRKITGDPDRDWIDQTLEIIGAPFERALMLNCGNGVNERDLFDRGVIKSAIGIDISPGLLADAENLADGRPFEYHQMDVNTADFPTPFDAIFNIGSCHHIARIDRVFRRLCELLPAEGWFISNDYIGPHRNQYSQDMWAAAWELNEQLPVAMRQLMTYPHLPTMLAVDPTEGIHSELIVETFERYFTTPYFAGFGGAIAYLLLTHNDKVVSDPVPWAAEISQILDADDRCGLPPLFAYWAGQPRKASLTDPRLATWTADEELRETTAARRNGEYYPRTMLQTLTMELVDAQVAADHARTSAPELEAELAAMRSTVSWRVTAPLRKVRAALRDGKRGSGRV